MLSKKIVVLVIMAKKIVGEFYRLCEKKVKWPNF